MQSDRSSIGTGILLITIGLLFMADRQGYASFRNLWPLILIVAGVGKMLFPNESSCEVAGVAGIRRGRRHGGNIGSGLWLILVGTLLLANQNGWMSFRDSWPLFIVAGGLAMIFGGWRRPPANPDETAPASTPTSIAQDGGQWK